MSKLEEIEQYAGYSEFDLTGEKAIPKSVVLKVEHYDWLIQQAERVEELERDKERLVTALEDEMNLTARMCELQDMEREEKEHYKQALEEIKKEAINHKQKGFAIQHWAVIKQIDIALEESQ